MFSCVNILTYCFQKMCLKFWQHFKLFLELVLRLLKMIKETKQKCYIKCCESDCGDLCSLFRYLFAFFPRFSQSSLKSGSEGHVLWPKEVSSILLAILSFMLEAPGGFCQSYYRQRDNIVTCFLYYLFICVCVGYVWHMWCCSLI